MAALHPLLMYLLILFIAVLALLGLNWMMSGPDTDPRAKNIVFILWLLVVVVVLLVQMGLL